MFALATITVAIRRRCRCRLAVGTLLGLLVLAHRATGAVPTTRALTDGELLSALDLSAPGLAAAKGLDSAAAQKAVAAYFRARTSVPWEFDPHKIRRDTPYDHAVADAAVRGQIVNAKTGTAPIAEINWQFNKARIRQTDGDNDSLLRLLVDRMPFWSALGDAYWATGDEKYAQAWVQQLRKWVSQQPAPHKSVEALLGRTTWQSIDTGLRLSGSWLHAYHRFLHSPSFTDEDLILFLKASLEHGRHLRQFGTSGNHLTMEMDGLYTLGCVFPEFREAKDWRDFAAVRLYDDMKVQFLPDGAQIEGTPGYHNLAVRHILGVYNRAVQMGRLGELPADYRAGLERAYDYDLYLMAPDRTLPKLNDSWAEKVPSNLREATQIFPNRADFLWVAMEGREGSPPRDTSHDFPYVGYFVMRSGWERDANYLLLDAGPLGFGHVHQDKLNVLVWAYGRELLFDSGGGPYNYDSPWRKWAIDTFSHNTVLVDGLPQRRQTTDKEANISRLPLPDVRWTSQAGHDFAAGIYQDGYGKAENKPAAHARRVAFLKPDVFIVADTLVPVGDPNAVHTYQARWHLLSTETARDPATSTVATTDSGRPNLAIVPLLTAGLEVSAASAQMKPELLGWNVRKDQFPINVPATTVLHTRQGTGTQRFLTLLLPLKPQASQPVKAVRAGADGTVEASLADGRRLKIEPGDGMDDDIRVSEIGADGKVLRASGGR
jgi:hypothetical protein